MASNSARLLLSNSEGTNMLPGSERGSLSRRTSGMYKLPMPTSSPCGLNSAAPEWLAMGGLAYKALSRWYSQ